jgi:hypothetical protein
MIRRANKESAATGPRSFRNRWVETTDTESAPCAERRVAAYAIAVPQVMDWLRLVVQQKGEQKEQPQFRQSRRLTSRLNRSDVRR